MKNTLLLVTVSLALATGVFAEEPDASRVLLAFEKTRFKQELIETMQKQLEADGYSVTVMRHSKKGLDAKAEAFDAIFITNTGAHSKVRPWIVAWIAENETAKDRILLHTTQTRDWEVKTDVDAVTSASARNNITLLATEYVTRIKTILLK